MPLSLDFFGDPRVGFALSLVLLLIAWKIRWATRGAVVIGVVVGTLVFSAFGWPGFVLLISFFALGELSKSHAINVLKRKERAIAEGKEGALKAISVFVPMAIPAFAAAMAILSTREPNQYLALLAFIAALTSTLGDKISTDLGQAYGKRTYQLITLDRVRSGTRGGVSIEGALYGAAMVVIFVGFSFGLFHAAEFSFSHHELYLGAKAMVILVLASLLANQLESVLSGILAQYQRRPNKQVLNFLGGLIGALLALFFTNLPEA